MRIEDLCYSLSILRVDTAVISVTADGTFLINQPCLPVVCFLFLGRPHYLVTSDDSRPVILWLSILRSSGLHGSSIGNCWRNISNSSTLFICCLFCHIRSARDSHLQLNNIYIKGVVTLLCCRRVVDVLSTCCRRITLLCCWRVVDVLSTYCDVASLITLPFLSVVCFAKSGQPATHTFK